MSPAPAQSREEMLADDARLADLLRRGRAGDRDAYRLFLTEIGARLRRQMRSRIAGLPEADLEDLVQEILLSIHASRATWDGARPVLPWIAAITRFRAADHFRRRGRRGKLSQEMAQMAETFSAGPTNRTSEEVIDAMSMDRALTELSATERRAFTLVRLRGLSLAEAARSSGSTVAAMKIAVHRAARKLQSLFEDGRL